MNGESIGKGVYEYGGNMRGRGMCECGGGVRGGVCVSVEGA